ncbi:NAD-glutamate dehydrogenase [Bosea caraganae]|uniref:NAD-glutamate dehydrogenase n=1 Tax=Bosea caraganae TaxID=2763117 RepID=A0A370KZX5_9HYPH|nr:NAD-glutamate dehydrogenase [Bosea caraganae]RDJ20558.1 NAD-glutamate dehydrogenase [Bosea caraganae]RDJ28407.1 NAD-glutamate dehydrogenase [Bosea caraganae]
MTELVTKAAAEAVAAIEAAAAGAANGMPTEFPRLLFGRSVAEDLVALPPAMLARAAEAAYEHLTATRAPNTPNLRFRDEAFSEDGRDRQITILEVVNDNRAFLLDSTLAELTEQGYEPRLVAHPILAVARDADGAFLSLAGEAAGRAPEGTRRESLIHIHLDRIDTPEARERLKAGLERVYVDVGLAVDDWASMRGRITEVIQAYRANPPPLPEDEVTEALNFLEWIAGDNFTLLGMRAYRFPGGDSAADPVDGTGLGILRDPEMRVLRKNRELVVMTPEIRDFLAKPQALIITKANVKSLVHRRVHLDYVGVKLFTAEGRLDGELRIVGLLTSNAYTGSARAIPYLRLKVARVVRNSGFDASSYSGRALLNVLDAFPRDELFQIDAETLESFALDILQLTERPRIRALARVDEFDRFVSILVFIPKDRYDTSVRRRVGEFLARIYQGRLSAAYPAYPDGPLSRTHYIVGRDEGVTPQIDRATLESGIAAIVRTWADSLKEVLDEQKAGPSARALTERYAEAFGAAYRERFSATDALEDIDMLQKLSAERPRAVNLYRREGDPATRANLKVFSRGAAIALSARVPVLENMGFRVVNERTFNLAPQPAAGSAEAPEASRVWLHDMTLERANNGEIDVAHLDPTIEAALMAQFRGLAESDRFDQLVLAAGLAWREAALLRALGRYLRQVGAPYAQGYIADVLTRHSGIAAGLVAYFIAKFDPRLGANSRTDKVATEREAIEAALNDVTSLDEDRILRRFVNLVDSALRTNFFQTGPDGHPRSTISIKFECAKLDELPLPRPLYEIFVYSPRVEGVHLRFGKVARGGLRWSDRPQDFRTEVLGLVKAQQVKNAVIVPVGAKGGFFPKQLPPASDRQAWLAEGTESYRIFVRTLLELTDNLDGETVVPPPETVRHDGDDPYLVVAADKGTATFSDTANALSLEKGHWLGDAFASGGSQGYDHKKMGITARGAWEAVKRHFREIDVDIQTTPFTVAGVGDMSGDVFGNGMLLSPAIKLVAAFDHRDIFLDPEPDAAASLAERQRLFDLPRSSWQDYDKSLISAGGGIFSRQAKSIPLSPAVQAMLDLDKPEVTPLELMTAILKARVDLLWFGGIGTYIRASDETDAQVGDRANDAIRVTGGDIRAKVIGEGANLGATQRGRIEAGRKGVRLNTDAIDNSAGVNTSDVEVNIKIALAGPVRDGRLAEDDRNALLVTMTDEVGLLVLRNNYLQTLALSLTEAQGPAATPALRRLMLSLEAEGRLDRSVEYLPTDIVLAEREKRGEGLTRPELSVLLAYAKLALHDALLESAVPDDLYLNSELTRYFPKALRESYGPEIAGHKLRREIVATQLANAIVNRGGPAIVSTLADQTRAEAPAIAAAYAIARDSFDLIALNTAIDALDAKLSGKTQMGLYAAAQELVTDRMSWFLRRGVAKPGAIEQTVAHYAKGVAALAAELDGLLPEAAAQARAARIAVLTSEGVPEALANRIASLPALAQATDIVDIAERTGRPIAEVARIHFGVDSVFGLSGLANSAGTVPATDDYERMARERAVETLVDAHAGLTQEISAGANGTGTLDGWLASRAVEADRTRATVSAIAMSGLSLPKLMVAAGMLADLPRRQS